MAWLQLKLAITPEQAAEYEDILLDCGAVSVTFMDAEDQPIFEPELGTTPLWKHTHLLALFEGDTAADQLVLSLVQALGTMPQYELEVLEDQDWERNWMDNFQPLCFGSRLWIVPSWCEAPNPNGTNLLLDPGLAFGTGTHPTTALCLEWLDQYMEKGLEVIDFGCGSGILAIAALLLGAKQVVGTDIDMQALEASLDNAKRNQIPEEDFAVYLPEQMPEITADVVLANILAGPLVALASKLAKLTRATGWICLSGILEEQASEVRAAYEPYFNLYPTATKDGWVRITGQRK
ncbi:50S ribosomal protein L11 methyltransferase [Entomomonas sp. E2T0]|uniref:50S ribosomal protein L11 methyltransferase n=1 Tax=Entomomonas sp. E2T0 TaxID=2930213 RepID=UPI00222850AA|nr:50S ribosomal protein L11 methyltransferase [Entomomonas sp. E2T0]UYZ84018.1 50S ribosomal protein L11 methyltransferase [Entomomonas sp. E2T0]